ncbi:unnamed protein product [Rotaria socialis]|uniref:Uncharacterized protein n=1 Tax=Rotaria socialis TaxID=392032 RepID=A0A820S3U4_9BILA|nr:unnamed protein product [Rotaria socialis]CAF3336678.1 unnamed protein product [Rotaria socialis]CAF3361546.1 unnamed protein product [Rotaria socialis]CAF3492553.1 unnamed protein product [Rotaria socialis]CAF3528773.1 unnamed protein product [Rotaria socialis]
MTTTKAENKNGKSSETDELAELNKLFTNRYTDEDEEYIKMAKPRSNTPPIVPDWGQTRNNYRNQPRFQSNRYRNNNYDNRSHYRQDRSRSPPHHYDRRR